MPSENTTGNTGEWSELYALAFILANGGMYAADEDQNKIDDLFYKVLEVIFENGFSEGKLSYKINGDVIEIIEGDDVAETVKTEKIKTLLGKMLSDLMSENEGRAYALVSGSDMMRLLRKEVIKAASSDKKDLDLILIDPKTKQKTPETGFSIKSQLGSPSTLLNASMATNFTFEVLDSDMNVPERFPELHEKNVKDNVELLLENGYNFVFKGADSEVFNNNLALIDSNMSKYIGDILLAYYSRKGPGLKDLIDDSFPEEEAVNKQPRHKIKEFISVMALGMMPNTDWNGMLTSLGGLLLVNTDGDVFCYYLYNLEDFQNYLISNTKLETPSTTRYGIGRIIREEGKSYMKLNLQVRFTR